MLRVLAAPSALLLFCELATSPARGAVIDYDVADNVSVLEGKLQLHWKIADDYACFRLSGKTADLLHDGVGWMGVGFPEQNLGGMQGADFGVVTFVGGEANVSDMWSPTTKQPSIDVCNDWAVASYEVTGEKVLADICRLRETGDPQDRPLAIPAGITSGMFLVSVAYGKGHFAYHGASRTSLSVNLFPSLTTTLDFDKVVSASSGEIFTVELLPNTSTDISMGRMGDVSADVTADGFMVPREVTSYVDFRFNAGELFPDLGDDEKWHIVGFEPIINTATAKFVHHFVVSLDSADSYAWASGGKGLLLPEEAGFPLSKSTNINLNTHYDNPAYESGVLDNSGLRLYVTKTPREHDAGMLEIGDGSVSLMGSEFPAGSFLLNSKIDITCPGGCLQEPLRVFGTLHHMHSHGIGFLVEHVNAEGAKVPHPLLSAEYYDWKYQSQVAQNFTISPGDSFRVTCIWNGKGKQGVRFGLGSEDEMCIFFVYYWPKMDMLYCGLESHGDVACGGRQYASEHALTSFQWQTWPAPFVGDQCRSSEIALDDSTQLQTVGKVGELPDASAIPDADAAAMATASIISLAIVALFF